MRFSHYIIAKTCISEVFAPNGSIEEVTDKKKYMKCQNMN